jgi:hypothetical protein
MTTTSTTRAMTMATAWAARLMVTVTRATTGHSLLSSYCHCCQQCPTLALTLAPLLALPLPPLHPLLPLPVSTLTMTANATINDCHCHCHSR